MHAKVKFDCTAHVKFYSPEPSFVLGLPRLASLLLLSPWTSMVLAPVSHVSNIDQPFTQSSLVNFLCVTSKIPGSSSHILPSQVLCLESFSQMSKIIRVA